jgi:CPA2 family monovalent cation:H+ antiporter-2
MPDAHAFLQNLALVLCVAAATTVLCQRLHLPVVFGYLLAGMIVGPHLPIPIVADPGMMRTLSELGVILLMFSIGLEFSLRSLLQVGPLAGPAALAETSLMFGLGFAVGRAFGWSTLECLFIGAAVAISSTTIIARAFAERGVKGRLTEIVFGILIVEDLIAIFLVAVLTAIGAGGGLSAGGLALTAVRLVTFLVGLVSLGLLTVPRLVRAVVRLHRDETTLVASVGICFAAALLALAFGYSVALGAFIAGALVAESGEARTVERLIQPVRDMFVAIFFVSVGMLIDLSVILSHWGAVLALSLVVVGGKLIAVSVGTFLSGNGLRLSVQAGMSLAQIGEFSFIIIAVGLATGATREFLYPVAVAVSAITSLATPWLIRMADPVASYVDRTLPRPMQTFAALYGSWIERMRSGAREDMGRDRMKRLVRVLLLDAILLAGVVIGAAAEMGRFTTILGGWTHISERAARWVVVAGGAVISVPLIVGLARSARLLGLVLAVRALPTAGARKVDLAMAPRRALVVTLQLAILLVVGLPFIAITGLFLPPAPALLLIGLMLTGLGVAFWRSAVNLQGHARAGAEVIVAAIAKQLQDEPVLESAVARRDSLAHTLDRVHTMLPGLGEPIPIRIEPNSPAVDRTLAQLNVRALTGATVLCIIRDGAQVLVPTGHEVLRAGDVLAVAGSHEAAEAARMSLAPS